MFVGRICGPLDGVVRPGCAVAVMRSTSSRRRLGAVAGERQEHVVEAGPGQPDVVDLDRAVLQPAGDAGQVGDAVGRRGELARARVDVDLGAGAGEQLARRRQVGGVGDRDDQAGVARLLLELQRRALRDDPAVVDHDDVVGELVGLFEVLRGQQQRGALGDEAAQHLPQIAAAARVQAGGGLVEEQHGR